MQRHISSSFNTQTTTISVFRDTSSLCKLMVWQLRGNASPSLRAVELPRLHQWNASSAAPSFQSVKQLKSLCRKRPPLSITHRGASAIPRSGFNQRNRSHQQVCWWVGIGCSNLSWLSRKGASDASSAGGGAWQLVLVGSSSSTGLCDHTARSHQTNQISSFSHSVFWFLKVCLLMLAYCRYPFC